MVEKHGKDAKGLWNYVVGSIVSLAISLLLKKQL